MIPSFHFVSGRLRTPLRLAVPQCVAEADMGARTFLNPHDWASEHARGSARSHLRDAATWMFSRAYVSDGKHLDSDAAFLAEQVARIAAANQRNTSSVHASYLVAAAAVRWAAEGSLPKEPLAEAALILDRLDGADSGMKLTATAPRNTTWEQQQFAAAFSVEATVRSLLGDWAWIDRAWAAGLDYLDGLQRVTSPDHLLRLWKRLSEASATNGERRLNAVEDAQKDLNGLGLLWATSFSSGERSDITPALLYLAGWGFETYAVGQEPSAAAVNDGLRGDV
jgi:hypothetical protein